jgi:photosystem II stability/assembly factor-like uncharacterized protein
MTLMKIFSGLSWKRTILSLFTLFIIFFSGLTLHISRSVIERYQPAQVSGTTWEYINYDFPNAIFRDVKFINATHGWILGEMSPNIPTDIVVLHTDDSGNSWNVWLNQSSQSATIMDVIDDQTVWINGLDGLYYTINSGQTWNRSEVMQGRFTTSTVKFINKTHGWTSANRTLFRTTNSGQSWEIVSGWTFDDSPRMMQILLPYSIWAMGFEGIYHSEDGGETWEETSNRGGWAVSFVSENEGWAVADNRLAHTTDGDTWEELTIPGRAPFSEFFSGFGLPYLSDIQFIDEDHGWIAGGNIDVMYTPDGGANWYEQSVPQGLSQSMMAVDFINHTHGWVVGALTILRTTNGNSLGLRLWNGMNDSVFLTIIAIAAVSIIVIVGGVLKVCRRRELKLSKTSSYAPTIE